MSSKTLSKEQAGFLELLRAVFTIVVMLHHFPALDPTFSIGKFLYLKRIRKRHVLISKPPISKIRRSLEKYSGKKSWVDVLMLKDTGPGKIAADGFLVITGYLFSQKFEHLEPEVVTKSLLKRFPRLCGTLFFVQTVNYVLYYNALVYANYAWFPSLETINEAFQRDGLFAAELNGALWMVESFFFAPFFVFIVKMILRSCYNKHRSPILAGIMLLCYVFPIAMRDQGTVLLGMILEEEKELMKNSRMGILTPFVFFIPWFFDLHEYRAPRVMASFAAVYFFMVTVSKENKLFKWFAQRRLVKFIASRSYQIYIWHLVVFNFCGASILPLLLEEDYDSTNVRLLYYMFGVVLVFFVANVSHLFVERPINKITEWSVNRIVR